MEFYLTTFSWRSLISAGGSYQMTFVLLNVPYLVCFNFKFSFSCVHSFRWSYMWPALWFSYWLAYCLPSYPPALLLWGVSQLLSAHQAMSSRNSARPNIANSLFFLFGWLVCVFVVVCFLLFSSFSFKSRSVSQNLRWVEGEVSCRLQ